MSKYLVTPALPYANGAIHIGHLVEHVQVNTYVRALRMLGEDVLYVCGADSHGTAIEMKAEERGETPENYAASWQKKHEATFRAFSIEFDGGYGTTHTKQNQAHANRIYEALKSEGMVVKREIEQLYDPAKKRFLADRLIQGDCPRCKTPDQYGDSCEKCGATYRATELGNPKSTLSGATPELRKSQHVFVVLQAFEERLRAYLRTPGIVHPSVRNFLDTWFQDGLKDWDISRDGPYFGFPIPGEENQFFYVWLDAPIGYASLADLASGGKWESYFNAPDVQIEHFIGKDILYFHTLFWPALLMAAKNTLPAKIRVHGMLTVNGTKMSKSRGTFINADDFVSKLPPEALRYYFAAKLTEEPTDIDFSLTDFTNRVNADLVNNIINLLSRSVPLLHRFAAGNCVNFDASAMSMVAEVRKLGATVFDSYRSLDFAAAVRSVVEMANLGNKYLQDRAPWELHKTQPQEALAVLSTALWIGKSCIALLKPILPTIAQKTEAMLYGDGYAFTASNALDALPIGKAIAPYDRLFERLDIKLVETLVTHAPDAQQPVAPVVKKNKPAAPAAAVGTTAPAGPLTIDEFNKVDLRVGRVIAAKDVDGSDKLISVELDFGPLGQRHVFSGLRPHVQAAALIGRNVVVVFNLAPRKMKFGISEGMILAAGEIPVPLFIDGATPGDSIR